MGGTMVNLLLSTGTFPVGKPAVNYLRETPEVLRRSNSVTPQ